VNQQSWTSKEELFLGIWKYKDIFKKELDLINRIEKAIENDPFGKWEQAFVGYGETRPSYRDCFDFKLNKNKSLILSEKQKVLNSIWQDAYDAQIPAVLDYCNMYSIKMDFWEAMNFIKYGPGQHFEEHADHGFSYVATVSLVGYPNDDYEGGELYFPKLDLKITPEAGDLYIFPSTYLFSHKAMPVASGTKYSIVTMLDYNDNCHSEDFYKLIMPKQNV
jgi:hypothetical protein